MKTRNDWRPYRPDELRLLQLELAIEHEIEEHGEPDPPLSDCPNCNDTGCPYCEGWYDGDGTCREKEMWR